MTVLILSEASDIHAHAVMERLGQRGSQVELLDLAEFPTRLTLSMAFENSDCRFVLARRGGGYIDLSSIRSVWWRRPQPFQLPSGMSPIHRRFAVSEAITAFHGLWQSMRARWINVPALDSLAAHKPYQLALAQEVGFQVPETLMTNNADEARAFWRRYEGEVIYKQFIAMKDTWRETRRLSKDDESHSDSVNIAPVIFQRHVPATADLRVTVVGNVVFAAGTDVRNATYPYDVRVNTEAIYEPHTLPNEIVARITNLMQKLGLVYGAIDLRLTPDGQYVFLEINPAGQFLFIEQATGQKISAALADALLNENVDT